MVKEVNIEQRGHQQLVHIIFISANNFEIRPTQNGEIITDAITPLLELFSLFHWTLFGIQKLSYVRFLIPTVSLDGGSGSKPLEILQIMTTRVLLDRTTKIAIKASNHEFCHAITFKI